MTAVNSGIDWTKTKGEEKNEALFKCFGKEVSIRR